MQISADYSTALDELIQDGDAPIDAIEVGPWYGIKDIARFQQRLPGWEFYFHPGGMIDWIGTLPGAISHFQAYQKQTKSPWLSVHLSLLRMGTAFLYRKFQFCVPARKAEKAVMRLIRQIEVLKGAVSVPVILENMPCLPHEGIYYQIFPQYINQVIEETGCGFLLDIAHARIASKALNMCFVDYLYQLPLEKVVQVHISGPRLKLGRLHDTHEPLQELDYELLEWVLDNTRPKILTLEYFRDKRALRDQLYRLRDMVDKNNLTV